MTHDSPEWKAENERLAREHGCELDLADFWFHPGERHHVRKSVTDALVDKSLALREVEAKLKTISGFTVGNGDICVNMVRRVLKALKEIQCG